MLNFERLAVLPSQPDDSSNNQIAITVTNPTSEELSEAIPGLAAELASSESFLEFGALLRSVLE